MLLNFYDATKSYTAMALQAFSNLHIKINDTATYEIPILFSNPSRLKQKLAKPDKTFTYRTPIMGLEINIDAQSSLNRTTNSMFKRKVLDIDNIKVGVTYNDKPCDFLCTLTVIADTMTSLTNIVEGINSLFPNNVLYATYKTPFGDELRTPMKLEDIGLNIDNNDGVQEDDRYLEATFMIRIEGVIHSNYHTTSSRIKEIEFLIKDYTFNIDTILERYSIKA